jgi:hypothetical protein
MVPQLLAALVGKAPRPSWITLAESLLKRNRAAKAA